jgi:hypothetical protein
VDTQRDLRPGPRCLVARSEMGLRREQIRNSDCVRLRATGTAEADRRVARVHAPGETAICIDFPFRPHQGRVLPSEARLRVPRQRTVSDVRTGDESRNNAQMSMVPV